MKILFVKDKNKRFFFALAEKKKLILKYLLNNLNLSQTIRENAYNEYLGLGSRTTITKIHNRCIFTNRARGNFRKFKLSRIFFKKYALEGKLMGIKKASW